jgi:hypothetical protein
MLFKKQLLITISTVAFTVITLTACGTAEEPNDNPDAASPDPVYADMVTWDMCEVLDDLQPITDQMGIEGYGSAHPGGNPGSRRHGNTWDPDLVNCGQLIYLGSLETDDGYRYGVNGEIKVGVAPAKSAEWAATIYEERVGRARGSLSDEDTVVLVEHEIGAPWDEGVQIVGRDYAWKSDREKGLDPSGQHRLEMLARDGQWVFHISLYYSRDWAEGTKYEPIYDFTVEDLNRWFRDSYLPEVHQAVNDRIAGSSPA